jgi:hypothetical protein
MIQHGEIFLLTEHRRLLQKHTTLIKKKLRPYTWILSLVALVTLVYSANIPRAYSETTTNQEITRIQQEIQRAQQALQQQQTTCSRVEQESQSDPQRQNRIDACNRWMQDTSNYIAALQAQLQNLPTNGTNPPYNNQTYTTQSNNPTVQALSNELYRAQQTLSQQQVTCRQSSDPSCNAWMQKTVDYINELNNKLQQATAQAQNNTPMTTQNLNSIMNTTQFSSNNPNSQAIYNEIQRAQQELRRQQDICRQNPSSECQTWMQKTIDYINQLQGQLQQSNQYQQVDYNYGNNHAMFVSNYAPEIRTHVSFCQEFSLNEEQCIAVWVYIHSLHNQLQIYNTPQGKEVIDPNTKARKSLQQYMKEKYPERPWEKMQSI